LNSGAVNMDKYLQKWRLKQVCGYERPK
jgi:hypothetical protein